MKAREVDSVGPWRQARAIALLPGIVTVVVPAAMLVFGDGPQAGWGWDGVVSVFPVLLGMVLIAAGVALWTWTVRLFARLGKGTLAPWDPTRRLVVAGPYRYVRNPMISVVLCVLLGEAALFGSPVLLIWFGVFLTINWVGFVFYEEPGLVRRFGDEYREYRRNVPRWWPRHMPWALRTTPLPARTEATVYGSPCCAAGAEGGSTLGRTSPDSALEERRRVARRGRLCRGARHRDRG